MGKRSVPAILTAVGLLAGSLAVTPGTAVAAPPPQEPGVTLRVFDVQVPLSEICVLKPGQTPNVDKKMSTINWAATTDFGFSDNFVSQVIGNINVATAGSYTFRLSTLLGTTTKDDEPGVRHSRVICWSPVRSKWSIRSAW